MNNMKETREKIKSLRVLVVDDEDEIREGVLLFMRKFFENVDSAKDGEEALLIFKEDRTYDVVITDIQMPRMTGWKLIEALRAIDKDVFVTAMTGSHDDNQLISQCDVYLKKPVNIDSMIEMMKKIIEKRGL